MNAYRECTDNVRDDDDDDDATWSATEESKKEGAQVLEIEGICYLKLLLRIRNSAPQRICLFSSIASSIQFLGHT